MKKTKTEPAKNQLRQQLHEAGLRVTMARLAVLEQLEQASAPISHAELADILVPQGLDRATVYRNLMDLTDADLASRSEFGDHVWRFEKRRPHHHGHEKTHPHFVCVDCGQVTCLPDVKLAITPSPGSKRSVIGALTEVLLKGHCGQCA